MAKGALRPKNAFSGRLDLFLSADLGYVESRRSELHLLREVQVTRHRFGLREAWVRVLAASYFVQLIEQVAERATPVPELFALLTRALDYLESHNPDRRAVLHFERELARALGLPQLSGGGANQGLQHAFHLAPAPREKLLDALKDPPPGATPGPARG